MRRLLVTGASGFIGSACLPLLQAVFPEIHALARGTRPQSTALPWHRLDLLQDDPTALLAELRPTHLLHLAWIATPGEYWTSPLNPAWERASRTLLHAFAEHGGERFVGVGTCAEYDWSVGLCREDESALSHASPYGAAKNRFRAHAEQSARAAGLQFAWARLFFAFGPGEPAQRLLPSLIRSLLRGEPFECSAGLHARDFVYVKNVAAALTALVASDLEGAINVGSGEARSIRALVEPVARALGRVELVRFTKPALDEPACVQAHLGRLRDELGFRPPVDHVRALEETIAWWRAEAER